MIAAIGIVIVVEMAARDRAVLVRANGDRTGAVAKAFFVGMPAVGNVIMKVMTCGSAVLVRANGDRTGTVAKPVFVVVAAVDPAAVEMTARERAVRFRADGDAGLYTLDRAVMLSVAMGEDRYGQRRSQDGTDQPGSQDISPFFHRKNTPLNAPKGRILFFIIPFYPIGRK